MTQAGIAPGGNFTYRFKAWPAGTHYWHSHMDGMQSAKARTPTPTPTPQHPPRSQGMRGAIVIKRRDDPAHYAAMGLPYSEERLVVLSDEWRDPEASATNPNPQECSEG